MPVIPVIANECPIEDLPRDAVRVIAVVHSIHVAPPVRFRFLGPLLRFLDTITQRPMGALIQIQIAPPGAEPKAVAPGKVIVPGHAAVVALSAGVMPVRRGVCTNSQN